MTDTFEKTYTDWSIDVGTYKYEGITLNKLNKICMLLRTKSKTLQLFLHQRQSPQIIKLYNFVQVCSDQDTDLLHIELSVTNDGDRGAIIYGKNELGHQEVLQIIEDFIAHHKVPSLDDWEIVLDLRPEIESL